MTPNRFFPDTHARIPFSVIGIILILGSSVVSVYITRLEIQKSNEIASSLNVDDVAILLHYAESDMTTALNIAGMKGLKELGKTPVITSSLGPADDINLIRLQRIIQYELNLYLTSHFLYDTYANGRYAINVIMENETPIPTSDVITITPLPMRLERHTLPFIGPSSNVNHSTYLVASVPIDVEIRDISIATDTILTRQTLHISSILTSRYPLLESLTNEYQRTINGTYSPLWTLSTALSNVYSLIRGYKHYQSGKPENIVDNRHLSVLINSGLVLEQALVFSSIDPLSLIELARNTKQVLKQQVQNPLTILNQEMNGTSYDVQTDNLTKGSANVDAGDSMNTSIDDRFSLNLTEIAQRILYNITGVTLCFENKAGNHKERYIAFDENAEQNIKVAVQYYANLSYTLTQIQKHLQRNETTFQFLSSIASEIYHDDIGIQVIDRSIVAESLPNPGSFWTDGGAGLWESVGILPLSKQDIKPAKGHVIPRCALYEETYNVTYERTHSWYHDDTLTGVRLWNNMTDGRIETVIVQEILLDYARYNTTHNDVIDALYYNTTVNDPNLEDTLGIYLSLFPDSSPLKQQLLVTQNNQGIFGCNASVPGVYNPWVLDETWNALLDILDALPTNISTVHQNASQYTNPFILVKKLMDEYIRIFNSQTDFYLDRGQYQSDSLYFSVGKKTIYASREWFVSSIKILLEEIATRISDELQAEINAAIPSDMGCTAHNLTETLDETVDAVRNQFTIPFGLNMTLSRIDAQGRQQWNETVRLAVDQEPNYLDPFKKTIDHGEELWTLKLRNRCVFGPTGLPILPPTPATPWLMTVNLWVIDVEGEYTHLKIIDTSDETIFNPILGHEPQVYIREARVVTKSNVTLGENSRLCFGFTTVAFGLVPPWGMMVGDFQTDWYDDHTPGFEAEG